MVSTVPVAFISLTLSLSVCATGLADQCPPKHAIHPDASGVLMASDGWLQSSGYNGINAVDVHIASTIKFNQRGYAVSCIYKSKKGYVVLDKQFSGSADFPKDGIWQKHICLSAQNKHCDYSCTVRKEGPVCQW